VKIRIGNIAARSYTAIVAEACRVRDALRRAPYFGRACRWIKTGMAVCMAVSNMSANVQRTAADGLLICCASVAHLLFKVQ
jgi:hypothetical protein